MSVQEIEIRHFHLFSGLGGAAMGFNKGSARVGNLAAKFRCIGGVDVDASAIRDFKRLAGVDGTVLDLFDRDQYTAFHGQEPPAGWVEATPRDIQRAAGYERPDAVVISAPCKGFSGLLSEEKSKTAKYQALNRLTLRGIWLMLEAWSGDPPELVVFENVPRLATRGRALLDQITTMLRAYGYATAVTQHDCGAIGGLAQSRKRMLMVARHIEKVPTMLYQPERKPLRAVGDILGRMLLPGDQRAGPMHRIPSLAWKTWIRLAFVEAGSDWRSLNRLTVENGVLRDYLLVPPMHHGVMGVHRWTDPMGTVTGNARPGTGAFSIADVRFEASARWQGQAYGVRRWTETSGTVTGQKSPGQGSFCVADDRIAAMRRPDVFRIVKAGQGGERLVEELLEVPDPRSGMDAQRHAYRTGGHYGIIRWEDSTGAGSASAQHDNGRWSVADPRLPDADDKLVAVIESLDKTWHRPFTTLELAALQSLVDPEQHLIDEERKAWERQNGTHMPVTFDGDSDGAWRERIGNAIPPAAAQAIASEMGRTILLARSGGTFELSDTPIWVRPLAIALSVAHT
jgi:site-specific DNA-cytosine methylase